MLNTKKCYQEFESWIKSKVCYMWKKKLKGNVSENTEKYMYFSRISEDWTQD